MTSIPVFYSNIINIIHNNLSNPTRTHVEIPEFFERGIKHEAPK